MLLWIFRGLQDCLPRGLVILLLHQLNLFQFLGDIAKVLHDCRLPFQVDAERVQKRFVIWPNCDHDLQSRRDHFHVFKKFFREVFDPEQRREHFRVLLPYLREKLALLLAIWNVIIAPLLEFAVSTDRIWARHLKVFNGISVLSRFLLVPRFHKLTPELFLISTMEITKFTVFQMECLTTFSRTRRMVIWMHVGTKFGTVLGDKITRVRHLDSFSVST